MHVASDFREILESRAWTRPSDYGGFNPVGDYVILTQHRDSDALERSNWRTAVRALNAEFYGGGDDCFPDRPDVYEWRAGHWGVGWIEYLCVRADAPDDVLIAAAEIVASLEDFPCLDESDYSELEYEEACETWERESTRGRLGLLEGTGISIFAARRDELPHDDSGLLMERLRG